jgi:peptide chain release factor 2
LRQPGGYFDLDGLKQKIEKLDQKMTKPDFWQDQERARSISQESENMKKQVGEWEGVTREAADGLALAREAAVSGEDMEKELEKEYHKLLKKFNQLERQVLFSGRYDANNAIVSIHAGTGGTEAQDWAQMLLRMLLRYGEKKGFATRIIDETRGQEAGIKSVTFEATGAYAYGNLKSEAGVHRLVRISPFDAEKMRHTSFALVEVIPVMADEDEAMINEKDLRVDVFRSGGAGGQSVNRTDSAVRITHLPTGIVVKCQNERSQLQNRKTAMKILQAKLAELQEKAKGKELAEIRGEVLQAEWGNQIRSYVLQPYKMVKDHRTDYETSDPDSVLDGELDGFVEAYLKYISQAR